MGIYVKGMTKPKSCDECPIRLVALPKGCEIEIGCCPIVEVAEPHGRLIDADKLPIRDISIEYYAINGVTEDDIDNAPTVIETEE